MFLVRKLLPHPIPGGGVSPGVAAGAVRGNVEKADSLQPQLSDAASKVLPIALQGRGVNYKAGVG